MSSADRESQEGNNGISDQEFEILLERNGGSLESHKSSFLSKENSQKSYIGGHPHNIRRRSSQYKSVTKNLSMIEEAK